MQTNKRNIIVELTFNFSLKIIVLVDILELKRKFVIANQLMKSGTSIGANVREAQNAESPADFLHKIKISAKEADETLYWLELIDQSKNYPAADALITDVTSIAKVLSKIISSLKNKR